MYNIIRGRSGTDTNFYYDDWGRMISKDQGSYDATYEYRYGDKLYSATSDFPGEGTVEYDYGSDGKRRTRETATSYTWYNWDAGWNVINEETSGNVLERTYIHDPGKAVGTILAHADGASLANWRYYIQDMIGSTMRLRYHNRGYAGGTRYAPYGDVQNQGGSWNTTYMFTGKDWDDDAQMYYFPFRYYSPGIGTWITRDPLGMVDGPNVYSYVGRNPVSLTDPLGLGLGCLILTGHCNPGPGVCEAAREGFVQGAFEGTAQLGDILIPGADPFSDLYDRCAPGMAAGRIAARIASSALWMAIGTPAAARLGGTRSLGWLNRGLARIGPGRSPWGTYLRMSFRGGPTSRHIHIWITRPLQYPHWLGWRHPLGLLSG